MPSMFRKDMRATVVVLACRVNFALELHSEQKRDTPSQLGLSLARKAQGRTDDAWSVEKRFQNSWRNADTELKLESLV